MASLAERTDVNQDEAWTSLDALNIVNAIALGWGVEQLPTGDLNDDSLLDAKDVSIALAYADFWEASQADGVDRERAEDGSTPETYSGDQSSPSYCWFIRVPTDYEGPCTNGSSSPSGPSIPSGPSSSSGPSGSSGPSYPPGPSGPGGAGDTTTPSGSGPSSPSGTDDPTDTGGPQPTTGEAPPSGPSTSPSPSDQPVTSGSSSPSGPDSPTPNGSTQPGSPVGTTAPGPAGPSDPPDTSPTVTTAPTNPSGSSYTSPTAPPAPLPPPEQPSVSAPSGPTAYTLSTRLVGESNSAPDAPVYVYEGNSLSIFGTIEGGDGGKRPAVKMSLDANFNNTTSDQGETHYSNWTEGSTFWWTWKIVDDGKVFGNGTPRDPLEVKIEFDGKTYTESATVRNDVPRFISPPTLREILDEDGLTRTIANATYTDTGIFDVHRLTIADTTGLAENPSQTKYKRECDETKDGDPNCSWIHSDQLELVYDNTHMYVNPYPITFTVEDDDSGKAAFVFDKLDIAVNDDDDNKNDFPDLLDRGLADDDLVEINLSEYFQDGKNISNGTFTLQVRGNAVRVWDSPEKLRAIGSQNTAYSSMDYRDYSLSSIRYIEQNSVWLEGIRPGKEDIIVEWTKGKPASADGRPSTLEGDPVYGARITVTVWGIDVDIDSDNDNGFNRPEGDDWEEYLETNRHGIGKLIHVDADEFTPIIVRLPKNLDPNSTTVNVLLQGSAGKSGEVRLWNTYKSDPRRSEKFVSNGGSQLANFWGYQTLKRINYNPISGEAIIYVEATDVAKGHRVKLDIDQRGKPVDSLKVTLKGVRGAEPSDEVNWMVVKPGSFYPRLINNSNIRNAIASDIVYGQRDSSGNADGNKPPIGSPTFGLKLVTQTELRKYLAESELSSKDQEYVLDIFYYTGSSVDDGSSHSVIGLGIGLYLDHTGDKEYRLAFRGTNPSQMVDLIDNLSQELMGYSPMYKAASMVAGYLVQVPEFAGRLSTTGHSLGGGLASAAALSTGIHADTFNAAGLKMDTLLDPGTKKEYVPGALDNFANQNLFVDSYQVWLSPPRPDGTQDAPDILSFLQNGLDVNIAGRHFLTPAVGWPVHFIEGLHDLTAVEATFVYNLRAALNDPNLTALFTILQGLLTIDGVAIKPALDLIPNVRFRYDAALGALYKMYQSHGFDSIYYGLLHGPDWNVYNDGDFYGNGRPISTW